MSVPISFNENLVVKINLHKLHHLISFHWGCKRTTEDDMHPGSDHPQCQHIKVGLAVMFCKRLAS